MSIAQKVSGLVCAHPIYTVFQASGCVFFIWPSLGASVVFGALGFKKYGIRKGVLILPYRLCPKMDPVSPQILGLCGTPLKRTRFCCIEVDEPSRKRTCGKLVRDITERRCRRQQSGHSRTLCTSWGYYEYGYCALCEP